MTLSVALADPREGRKRREAVAAAPLLFAAFWSHARARDMVLPKRRRPMDGATTCYHQPTRKAESARERAAC